MLKNYWLIAIRKLWKHKVHTLINILGLTIGLASCLIIYLLTRFELSYDRFHPGRDRIYRIVAATGDTAHPDPKSGLIQPLAIGLQKEIYGCEAIAPFYNYAAPVTIQDKVPRRFDRPGIGQHSPIIVTGPEYFRVFIYQWLAGNAASSLDNPNTVVLTDKEMNRYFGPIAPDQAIGRQVIYNDSLLTTVSGIVKDWDQNTDFGFQDFISLSTVAHSFLKNSIQLDSWGFWTSMAQGLVRLGKGTTPAQVERQFPAFLKKYLDPATHPYFTRLSLQPLTDIHFNEAYPDGYSRKSHLPTLYGLMGIAGFILLLAVVNFVNLSTAQSLQRTKEVGIRKVVGGRRRDIIFQFLGETFLLTLLAVALSLLITPPVISLFHNWLPPGLRLDFSASTLLFLLGITVVTSLLAGWFPARVIAALVPVLSLKGQATRGLAPNRYLLRGLIVFQFTISLVFIMCTVVVARQLHYVLNTDMGFDKDAILTIDATGKYTPGDLEVLAQKIRALPGVALVSRDMGTPQGGILGGTDLIYHGTTDQKVNATMEFCDPDYIPLFGIRLVAGRNFFPSDTLREILVNETCAQQLGFTRPDDALGKILETGFGGRKVTIIGVVRDFHATSMHQAIPPFWFGTNSDWLQAVSVRLSSTNRHPEDVQKLLAKIEPIWHAVFSNNEKFSYSFFDDTIASQYEKEQKTSGLLRLAMLIAICISCMGLLGLVTFAAEQRQKEIGVRKVLGASVGRIFTLLTANFLWPVALAIVIATPVAWYFMHTWLQDFVYRTTVPWWIFAICGLSAIAIALVTVSAQALKAAFVNPVEALRTQ